MKPPYVSLHLMNSVGLTLSAQTSYPVPQGNMDLAVPAGFLGQTGPVSTL